MLSYKLCQTFIQQADMVSKNIFLAHRSGLSYAEETITESILLNLWNKNNKRILINPFTKRQEAQIGADWEWVIIGNKYTFKMRVQAKRLAKNDKIIDSVLKYKIRKTGKLQIDTLITQANNKTMMPVYCFYSPENSRKYWKSNGSLELGCLIGNAEIIKKQNSNKFLDLERVSFPWHYLVCKNCPEQKNFPSIDVLNNGTNVENNIYDKYLHETNNVDLFSYNISDRDYADYLDIITNNNDNNIVNKFKTLDNIQEMEELRYYLKMMPEMLFLAKERKKHKSIKANLYGRVYGVLGRYYIDVRDSPLINSRKINL